MSLEQGDAAAQNNYGFCLYRGEGICKNLNEAVKYFKMSADEGFADGQNNYGFCLRSGEGVSKNLSEAVKYFKMSADQGNSVAQHNYGMCLKYGEGISQDLSESMKYLKMSEDQGDIDYVKTYCLCISEIEKDSSHEGQGDINGAESLCLGVSEIESSSLHEEKQTSELVLDLSCYSKVKEIGRGKFGVVKLVKDDASGEELAVKYIEGGPDFDCGKLVREVSILASLNHPCIVKIVGWSLPNEECKKSRIAMEYVSNGSLESVLSRVSRNDIPTFWTHENITCMIVGLVLGMKYLHSKNIIHRDLKPGNLLLDCDNRLRICDFGTAIFEDCGTTTGIGTLAYISPESLGDAPPTKKADVFAFGLILYEILFGESVFPKDANAARIYKLHKTETRPEIPEWISTPISELIKSCWSLNPELRPTFDDIYDQLERLRFAFFDDVLPEVVVEYILELVARQSHT
jgi:hypothetical protein